MFLEEAKGEVLRKLYRGCVHLSVIFDLLIGMIWIHPAEEKDEDGEAKGKVEVTPEVRE
jgi:hypothetical protein